MDLGSLWFNSVNLSKLGLSFICTILQTFLQIHVFLLHSAIYSSRMALKISKTNAFYPRLETSSQVTRSFKMAALTSLSWL